MSKILEEGLPKRDPKDIIADLKATLYSNDTFSRYFDEDKESRYKQNFALFDRNKDSYINLEELKELLASLGQVLEETELEELYVVLEDQEFKGITCNDVFLLISKKIRDEDRETQLLEAFRIVNEEEKEVLDSEAFKELLMTYGEKWDEDVIDKMIKEGEGKGKSNEGKFNFNEFTKKVLKKKKKKGGGKKKKK